MDAALDLGSRLSRGVVRGLRLRPAGREAYVFCIRCEACTGVAGLDPGGRYAVRLSRGRSGRTCETAPVGVSVGWGDGEQTQWLDFGGQEVALDATVFVTRRARPGGAGDEVEGLEEKVAEFEVVEVGAESGGGSPRKKGRRGQGQGSGSALYRASLDVTQFLNWNARTGVLEGVGGDGQAVVIPLAAAKGHRGGVGSGGGGGSGGIEREPALLEVTLKVVEGSAAMLGYAPTATAGSRRASPVSSLPGTPTKGGAGVSPRAVAAGVAAQVEAQLQAAKVHSVHGGGTLAGEETRPVPQQAAEGSKAGAKVSARTSASPFAGLLIGPRGDLLPSSEPRGRPPTPRGGLRRTPSQGQLPPSGRRDGRPAVTASAATEVARYLEGLLFDTKQQLVATSRETERIRVLVQETEREIARERSTAVRLVASVQLYQQDLESPRTGRWARLKERLRRRYKP